MERVTPPPFGTQGTRRRSQWEVDGSGREIQWLLDKVKGWQEFMEAHR